MLVIVSIAGVLVALIIPAVAAVRGMARRAHCANNLRQYGLALTQYTTLHDGIIPFGIDDNHTYSPHVALLPFMEQGGLYDSINTFINSNEGVSGVNSTAATTTLSFLHCPADPLVEPGMTNYAGCLGDHRSSFEANGVFGTRVIGLQSVTDGSSSTVAMSEYLVGNPEEAERLRTNYKPDDFTSGTALSLEQFASRCENLRGMIPNLNMIKGQSWMVGQRNYTLYDHTLPINRPTCINVVGSTEVAGATSATSYHGDGANVLFADGHLRYLRESIDPDVWRALGTRSDGEVLSKEDY